MQPPWRAYLVSALVACVVAAATSFVTVRLIAPAGERPANPTPSALGEIRDGTLAPDRREAAFAGVLKMKDGKEFEFRVRVTPEGEGGRWRIDSVAVTT
jgi:hypothetical protein